MLRGTIARGRLQVAAVRADPVTAVLEGHVDDLDVDRLAAAYAEAGERVLDRLSGSYVLLLWDERDATGLLAVDRLATRSLFYATRPGALAFATEVRDLLALLPSAPPPDEAAVARWLAWGTLEPDETLYAGVRRLPGGRFLRLARGGWREETYWRPRFRPTRRLGAEEAAAELRQAVVRAVTERAEGEPLGVMLSGGLDSSTVAALAARVGPQRVVAYSAFFPDHPGLDESELVRLTVTDLGIGLRSLDVRTTSLLGRAVEHARSWSLPAPSPNLYFQLPLLALARADGVAAVLDGEGGDELFGAAPIPVNESAPSLRERARTTAPPWLRTALRRARRRTDAPAWLTPRARRLAADPPGRLGWTELDGPRWWASHADLLTRGRERLGVFDHLRRKSATAGITGRHPFLDDLALIELVLELPPELASPREHDRPLLRHAMRGLVHESVRLRRDKSFFDSIIVDSLRGPDGARLAKLLTTPDAEVRAYATPAALAEIAAGPEGGPPGWLWRAWRLAAVELWLRMLARAG